MPLKFKVVDVGLIKIDWATNVCDLDGEKHFPDICKNSSVSMPKFDLTLTYRRYQDMSQVADFRASRGIIPCSIEFDVQLRLKKTKFHVSDSQKWDKNVIFSRAERDEIMDNYDRPCIVWTSINGGEKSFLKEFRGQDEWTSENMHVPMLVPDLAWRPTMAVLNILLWIKFKQFVSVGEMKALKHLADMFTQQQNCDVQFCFEGVRNIGGHTNILAARSPVLAAMFQHDMQEAKTGQVDIKDIEPEIFSDMLHYVYSGRTQWPLTEEIAQLLFVAADKYDIEDLKEECSRFLLSTVRVDNAIKLMAWAHHHSVDKVKEATLTFAAQHGKQIVELDDYEELMNNYPTACLLITRRMMKCNLSL